MQLLAQLTVLAKEGVESAGSNGDSILTVVLAVLGGVLAPPVLLFLVHQSYGKRRPVKLVKPHYLCRSYQDGFTEATADNQGPSADHITQLRVVFKGRLLKGRRTVTAVSIKKRSRRWKDRPRGRRQLKTTGLEVESLPDDGVEVDQSQSKAYTLEVRLDNQSGLYWLGGDHRLVAHIADRHSRPSKIPQKTPIEEV